VAVLEGAIERLTRALMTADDDAIPALVEERRAMREELRAVRGRDAGPRRTEDARPRGGTGT
jgi:hypothetical protein